MNPQHPQDQQDAREDAPRGQVSEVASFGDGPEPISPEDATAGYPTSESGHPDEGPAGPDAIPEHGDERRSAAAGDRPRDPADDPGRGPTPDEQAPAPPGQRRPSDGDAGESDDDPFTVGALETTDAHTDTQPGTTTRDDLTGGREQ